MSLHVTARYGALTHTNARYRTLTHETICLLTYRMRGAWAQVMLTPTNTH